jgi:two-component system, sensor histidine kinase PdtaS
MSEGPGDMSELVQEEGASWTRRVTAAEVDAALRHAEETEGRFRTLADTAPVLLWMSGQDGLCDFFNQGWLNFTGRSLAQELGNGWAEGIHAEDFAHSMQTYLEAFVARRAFSMEYRLRRHDGEYRWIFDQGAPRFDRAERFVGFIGSCVDVTAQREAHDALGRLNQMLEDRVRERTQLANERAMLLREVHHRVKNDLQLVCSLLSLQERELGDSAAARAIEDCEQRVQAIAMIHEHMYQSDDLARLSLSGHLRTLTSHVEQLGRGGVELALEVAEQVMLGVDQAIPCAMIVHELVVNCFRHAFPDGRPGRVLVSCARGEGSMVHVSVADDGVGMPEYDREPPHKGLGLTLVQTLAKQLRATLEVTCGSGTRVELRFSDATASSPTRSAGGLALPSGAVVPLAVSPMDVARSARSRAAVEAEV